MKRTLFLALLLLTGCQPSFAPSKGDTVLLYGLGKTLPNGKTLQCCLFVFCATPESAALVAPIKAEALHNEGWTVQVESMEYDKEFMSPCFENRPTMNSYLSFRDMDGNECRYFIMNNLPTPVKNALLSAWKKELSKFDIISDLKLIEANNGS